MTTPTIYMPKNSMEDAVPLVRTATFDLPADVPAATEATTTQPDAAAQEAATRQAEAAASAKMEAEAERDPKDREACQAYLREKWGEAYDDRINAIDKTLETTGMAAQVRGARLPGGSMLLNHPHVIEAMWRITQIHAFRRENRAEYNRSERMQGEERALITRIASMIGAA